MRGFSPGKSVIAAVLACALSTAALGSGVDNPVDPVTGIPLPLTPLEKLHLTADGKCGILAFNYETFDRASFAWQGACRFGLAHGWGYMTFPDGKAARALFTYGWRDIAPAVLKNFDKTYRNNRDFGGDYVAVSFDGMDRFNPARFYDSGAAVMLQVYTGANYVGDLIELRSFSCPFENFADLSNNKPTRQEIALAKKVCSQNGGGNGSYIFHNQANQARDNSGNWVDTRPRVQEVRVCGVGPMKGVPGCYDEAAAAAAPFMARIEETIAADATAVADHRKELTARFAPLEAAWREKIAELKR